jgi:3-dehydroquinate dehydratase type I
MICVSIKAKNNGEALEKMSRAEALADMSEIRLDLMESFDLPEIIRNAKKPVIVTYRSTGEGGKGSANDATRARYLLNTIETGADFVDVEYRMPPEFRSEILKRQGRSKVILSSHMLNGTPHINELEDHLGGMAATGAEIVKIVTLAREREDNLRVMRLIPKARKMGIAIITFCMGPIGRVSRIASPLLGGFLTFASLDEGEEAGDGQIPVAQMTRMLETLNRCS